MVIKQTIETTQACYVHNTVHHYGALTLWNSLMVGVRETASTLQVKHNVLQ